MSCDFRFPHKCPRDFPLAIVGVNFFSNGFLRFVDISLQIVV